MSYDNNEQNNNEYNEYNELINNLQKNNIDKNENRDITKFNKFINKILILLEINNDKDKSTIISLANNLQNNKKIKLINNLEDKMNSLLEEDKKIAKFKYYLKKNSNFDNVENNWKKLIYQMGKLQALILINKLKDNNVNGLISTITKGFDNKFNMLNNILEENAGIINQQGGYNNMYNYIKYKIKYINEKNL